MYKHFMIKLLLAMCLFVLRVLTEVVGRASELFFSLGYEEDDEIYYASWAYWIGGWLEQLRQVLAQKYWALFAVVWWEAD